MDFNVGRVLDALDRLDVARNTLVFWCTDNGAEGLRPWRGSPGPWTGFYNSVMEGGIRTPCLNDTQDDAGAIFSTARALL
jgi:arylsulfatase